MSLHKQHTPKEIEGLKLHRLTIGTPSQLSDAFVLGMRHVSKQQAEEIHMLNLEIIHLSDACDGISQHCTEAELDSMTLSLMVSQQAERIKELEIASEKVKQPHSSMAENHQELWAKMVSFDVDKHSTVFKK